MHLILDHVILSRRLRLEPSTSSAIWWRSSAARALWWCSTTAPAPGRWIWPDGAWWRRRRRRSTVSVIGPIGDNAERLTRFSVDKCPESMAILNCAVVNPSDFAANQHVMINGRTPVTTRYVSLAFLSAARALTQSDTTRRVKFSLERSVSLLSTGSGCCSARAMWYLSSHLTCAPSATKYILAPSTSISDSGTNG